MDPVADTSANVRGLAAVLAQARRNCHHIRCAHSRAAQAIAPFAPQNSESRPPGLVHVRKRATLRECHCFCSWPNDSIAWFISPVFQHRKTTDTTDTSDTSDTLDTLLKTL